MEVIHDSRSHLRVCPACKVLQWVQDGRTEARHRFAAARRQGFNKSDTNPCITSLAPPGPLPTLTRSARGIARMDDAKLVKSLEAAAYVYSPMAYWGKRPRQSYLIQREIVRLEICKRGLRWSPSLEETRLASAR